MTAQQSIAVRSELSRGLRGRVLVPGDGDWETARRPWNLRVDQRPAAIVEAEGAGDMAVAPRSPPATAAAGSVEL